MKKFTAYPYLLPSILCFLLLIVYPLMYTFYISLTNLGTGHILNITDAKKVLLNEKYHPNNSKELNFNVFENENNIIFLVRTRENNFFKAQVNISKVLPLVINFENISHRKFKKISSNNTGTSHYYINNVDTFEKIVFKLENIEYKLSSLSTLAETINLYKELDGGNVLNVITNSIYKPNFNDGYFENEKGKSLIPGFYTYVGFKKLFFFLSERILWKIILEGFFVDNCLGFIKYFVRIFMWTHYCNVSQFKAYIW